MRVWKIVWCSALLSSHWKSLLSSSDNTCNFWVRSCRKRCAHGHEHNQNKWKGKGGGLCAYSKIFDIDDCYTNEEDILHHSSLNIKWWVPSYIVYRHTHLFLPPTTWADDEGENCGEMSWERAFPLHQSSKAPSTKIPMSWPVTAALTDETKPVLPIKFTYV